MPTKTKTTTTTKRSSKLTSKLKDSKAVIQKRIKSKIPKGKKLISGGNTFTFKKVGDHIEGKFVSLTKTPSRKFKNNENVVITLEKDGIITNVYSSHHLTKTIEENKIKKGTLLDITLVEVKPLDNNRAYKLYEVYA